MKLLIILFLLCPLVAPAGLGIQAFAAAPEHSCNTAEEVCAPCCEPEAVRCCCTADPVEPTPPAPLVPAPVSTLKDTAAAVPDLIVLEELPRISEVRAAPVILVSGPVTLAAPTLRLCVLRCRLLL